MALLLKSLSGGFVRFRIWRKFCLTIVQLKNILSSINHFFIVLNIVLKTWNVSVVKTMKTFVSLKIV